MNYTNFLIKLESSGFDIQGKSYAFKIFEEWEIAFIRMSGKYQTTGIISFIICARPQTAKGLEGKITNHSKNPHDYPFKLTRSEINKSLKYESKLLNYEIDYLIETEQWENVLSLISKELPNILNSIGLNGLINQLKKLKDPGYIENIWIKSIKNA